MKSFLALAAFIIFFSGFAVGGLFAARTTEDAATAAASKKSVGALTTQIMTPLTTGQIAALERNDCERVYRVGAANCK